MLRLAFLEFWRSAQLVFNLNWIINTHISHFEGNWLNGHQLLLFICHFELPEPHIGLAEPQPANIHRRWPYNSFRKYPIIFSPFHYFYASTKAPETQENTEATGSSWGFQISMVAIIVLVLFFLQMMSIGMRRSAPSPTGKQPPGGTGGSFGNGDLLH